MKKHFKLMAALSAVGVLTAAAPEMGIMNTAGTAYASVIGWVEENGVWRFYEEADYYETDSWKKSENDWYYLNADGEIATDATIDDYYVDASGKRVISQWVSVENDNYWNSPGAPKYFWHYYGRDGKLTTSKWDKINGSWYYFDEDGRMLTGKAEIESATYYLGDANDGTMKTGWIQLKNESSDSEQLYSWYYFESDGEMIENQVDEKISGSYYTFVDGQMQTGWYQVSADATASEADEATVEGYQYYLPSGARAEGWRNIEGVSGISNEEEFNWFYFKKGAPFHAAEGIQLFSIGSNKYGFNTKGEMQTGQKVVNLENDEIANFYFGASDDGVMKTGKQTIYNKDLEENQTWYFRTTGTRKGQGYHGILDDVIYEYGLRKQADAEIRKAPVTFEGVHYLVNNNGTIQKATKTSKSSVKPELGAGFKDFKDSNGYSYVVDENGVIR